MTVVCQSVEEDIFTAFLCFISVNVSLTAQNYWVCLLWTVFIVFWKEASLLVRVYFKKGFIRDRVQAFLIYDHSYIFSYTVTGNPFFRTWFLLFVEIIICEELLQFFSLKKSRSQDRTCEKCVWENFAQYRRFLVKKVLLILLSFRNNNIFLFWALLQYMKKIYIVLHLNPEKVSEGESSFYYHKGCVKGKIPQSFCYYYMFRWLVTFFFNLIKNKHLRVASL